MYGSNDNLCNLVLLLSAQYKGCHVYVGQVFRNWHPQYRVEFYSPLYVAALEEEGDEHLLEDMKEVAAKG